METSNRRRLQFILPVVFAFMGAWLVLSISAAGGNTSIEAELAASSTVINEPSASNEQFIEFAQTSIEPDVFNLDFDDFEIQNYGEITLDQFKNFSPDGADFANAESEISIVEDGELGNVLEAKYVPKDYGSDRIQVPWRFPQGHSELYLSYKVKFQPGWEYVLGGKLPGLAGGSRPSGGTADPNGMTARLMWRGGDADGERIVVYLYWLNQPDTFGEDHSSGLAIPIDQWTTVTQRINIGTPGNADGSIQLWLDGVEYVNRQDMQFLEDGATWQIDSLYFSTFFGGGMPEWAPSKTVFARFADLKVATSAIGVDL